MSGQLLLFEATLHGNMQPVSVSNDLQSTILEYMVPRQRERVFDEVPVTPVDGVFGTSSN